MKTKSKLLYLEKEILNYSENLSISLGVALYLFHCDLKSLRIFQMQFTNCVVDIEVPRSKA